MRSNVRLKGDQKPLSPPLVAIINVDHSLIIFVSTKLGHGMEDVNEMLQAKWSPILLEILLTSHLNPVFFSCTGWRRISNLLVDCIPFEEWVLDHLHVGDKRLCQRAIMPGLEIVGTSTMQENCNPWKGHSFCFAKPHSSD